MSGEEIPPILEAVNHLLEQLFSSLGPWPTLFLLVFLALLTFGFRVYQDWRKEQEVDQRIKDKDRTIQRMAAELRMYRAAYFSDVEGWSDEKIERFIFRNDFSDEVEARIGLEQDN